MQRPRNRGDESEKRESGKTRKKEKGGKDIRGENIRKKGGSAKFGGTAPTS